MISISDEVRTVLEASSFCDGVLTLPPRQLERKLYEAVNKVLEALGGKWSRKAKGHVFETDPRDQLSSGLERGAVTSWKQDLQFFETPDVVIDEMLDHAELSYGMVVLEPSAGRGAIAKRLVAAGCVVDCCEQHEPFRSELSQCGEDLRLLPETDFLQVNRKYSRIVANPPFTKGADVQHVNHMLDLLLPNGILVSVMAAGIRFRADRKTKSLRDRLCEETVCTIDTLPSGAFKESGTGVSTVLLVARKNSDET